MTNIVDLRPNAEPDLTTAFERFWGFFPKQYGLGDARRQWIWALAAAQNDGEEIIRGAMAYARHVQREAVEWRYVLAPAKWLSGEHWKDAYSLAAAPTEVPYDRREALRASAAKGNRFSADILKRDYGE